MAAKLQQNLVHSVSQLQFFNLLNFMIAPTDSKLDSINSRLCLVVGYKVLQVLSLKGTFSRKPEQFMYIVSVSGQQKLYGNPEDVGCP